MPPPWSSPRDFGPRIQERSPHADGQTDTIHPIVTVVPSHTQHAHDRSEQVLHTPHHRCRQCRVHPCAQEDRILQDGTCFSNHGENRGRKVQNVSDLLVRSRSRRKRGRAYLRSFVCFVVCKGVVPTCALTPSRKSQPKHPTTPTSSDRACKKLACSPMNEVHK